MRRLACWDYSWAGAYFITIVTYGRERAFGKIKNGVLQKSPQAYMCQKFWHELKRAYGRCALGAFVIMPDHVHGIVWIKGSKEAMLTEATSEAVHELPRRGQGGASRGFQQERRNMLLAKIIGRFKMQTAQAINLFQNTSGQKFWQRNYYEHIIKDEAELWRIRTYIANNPIRWEIEKNTSHNESPSVL